MGRPRRHGLGLPPGVERVSAGGRVYLYWNPNRGTSREGERVPLPSDPTSSAFMRELARCMEKQPLVIAGTFAALVARYRLSTDYLTLSDSTRTSYDLHLDRMAAPRAWGELGADELTPLAVLTGRDALKDTPGMANQMLAVGRTLYGWALPLGLATSNPFEKVKPLEVPDRGHVPWPGWAIAFVDDHAWEDLRRMRRLAVATCQRESDFIRLGPPQREGSGLWCRPKKTRRKRRAFRVPLAISDAIEFDRWASAPMLFKPARFLEPIKRYRGDLYLYSPRGVPYNPSSLRARWNRWLRTKDGKELCRRWREWIALQIERYEWDIEPEDVTAPTIHGLRGTGILLRFAEGDSVDRIANDVGMNKQTVERYMRFRDQIEVAEQGRKLRVVQ